MLIPYVFFLLGFSLISIGGGPKWKDSNSSSQFIIIGSGYFIFVVAYILFVIADKFLPIYLRDSSSSENNTIEITRNMMITIQSFDSEETQEFTELPFSRSMRMARLALKALPPVKSFAKEEEDEDGLVDRRNNFCPICIEEFKDGELIQPFGVCVHEFHSACINSWLHSGKTSCPLCREDLATFMN
ncbi:RING-H2 finger protein ATL57-like [Arachis stenosperma]|uniref:RING-H2 finger protein ATL57-like n=1 Tax=Arachis stenosperma TaxID=217475 RepID=UPI0025AD96F3|nr:RING-H2 finger protein ATL57-like [Arachis stenosperma]